MKKSSVCDWVVAYLIPRFVYVWYRRACHPRWYINNLKKRRWAKSIKIGDVICTCSCRHEIVAEKISKTDVITTNGHQHDLVSCCDPVQPDDSCHSWATGGINEEASPVVE